MPKPKRKHLQIERTRHGRAIYYFRRGKGKRIRLPDSYGSKEFMEAYEAALKNEEASWSRPTRLTKHQYTRQQIERALKRSVSAARQRDRLRGREADLDLGWAIEQVERQNLRCALTGIPFYIVDKESSKTHPYCPSFDRIDTSKGYTKDNIRIVTFAVNAMLLDWGEEVFNHVASCYRHNAVFRRKFARTES